MHEILDRVSSRVGLGPTLGPFEFLIDDWAVWENWGEVRVVKKVINNGEGTCGHRPIND